MGKLSVSSPPEFSYGVGASIKGARGLMCLEPSLPCFPDVISTLLGGEHKDGKEYGIRFPNEI